MTDTAKPQKYSKVMPIEVEHEAEDVWQSTGLTPRQLLEQRNEYRSLLHRVFAESFGGYISWEGGDTENVYHIPCKIYDEVESALAKCGKVGG